MEVKMELDREPKPHNMGYDVTRNLVMISGLKLKIIIRGLKDIDRGKGNIFERV